MRGCKGDCNQGRKDCPHPFLCIGKVSVSGGPLGAPATQQKRGPVVWSSVVLWCSLVAAWAAVLVVGCTHSGWAK